MRQLVIWSTCAAIAFTGLSCKKDNDPPANSGGGGTPTPTNNPRVIFTIDGDGSSAASHTLTPSSGSGMALYSTADEESSGSLMMDASNHFTLLFEGQSTGTFACTGGLGNVSMSFAVNGAHYMSYTNTMEVTTYGSVGGTIEGTFSGTVIRMNGPTAGAFANVTGGSFRFRRIEDL